MSFMVWAEATLRALSLGEGLGLIVLTVIAVTLIRRR
jgi:hypothetical protein